MRRRTKGLVYFAIVVGILIIGMFAVVLTQSERIAIHIGDLATARYGKARNLTIDLGDISGSLFRDMRLKDICITYTGGGAPKIVLSASSVYLEFNPVSLLFGNVKIDSMCVESPKLVIPKRPDGTRVYPTGDSPEGPAGERSDFEISKISLRDAAIVWEEKSPLVLKDINAEASYVGRHDISIVQVTDGRFSYGKSARVKHLSGRLRILSDRVEIAHLRTTTEGSSLALSGFFGMADNDSLDFEATIDSLDIDEVPAFLRKQAGSGMGRIVGQVRGEGRYERVLLDIALDGDVFTWPLADLEASVLYEKTRIEIKDLTSVFNGSPFSISGEYNMSVPPSYRGVVAFDDLDLSSFIKDDSGNYSSDLQGSVAFAGRAFDRERFRVTTWPRLGRGRYKDWAFHAIGGRVGVTADAVSLDSVEAWMSQARLEARGRIGFDGTTEIAFSLDCRDLADLYSYHKADGLTGKVTAQGDFRVSRGFVELSAGSRGTNIDYKTTRLDSIEVDLYLGTSVDGPTGTARFFASGLDIGGFRGREAIADVRLEGRSLGVDRAVVTRINGDLIGLVGKVKILEDGFDVGLGNVFIEAGDFIWENTDTIHASYQNDSLSIDDFTLMSDVGSVSVTRSAYSQGRYWLESSVRDFDLALLKDAIGKEIPTGSVNLTFKARGVGDSLTFDLDFDVTQGDIRSVEFDTLTGMLAYDGRELRLGDITLSQDGGNVSLTGRIPIDLRLGRVSRLMREGRAAEIIQNLGSVSIKAEDMDISLLWPLLPPISKLRGVAGLELLVSGSKRNPYLATQGKLTGAYYGNAELGEVSWDLVFEDSLLKITEFTFGKGEETGRVSGELPLAISMLPFASTLLKRPMSLDAKVNNGDLGLLCEIFPRLKVCSGSYAIDMTVGGGAQDPLFYGSMGLSGARLRLEGVAQDLRDIHLEVVAEGKRFEIVRMIAEEGALTARGYFVLEATRISDWDLAFELEDLAITEFEDFYVRLAGDMYVRSEQNKSGKYVPRIEGSLTVKEGEYFYSLGRDAGGGAIIGPTASPEWTMNVAVEVPNALWIRGDDIDAELQGSLSVKRDETGLVVLGTLRTIRGRFYIYHNAFRLTRGEFRFGDVKDLRNVYIDLEAHSRVLDERVDISAKGTIDKLDVTASSESGWSETQIFEALTLRRGTTVGAEEEGKFFSSEFLRSWAFALANRLGDDVARELNLDQFGIEVGDAGEGDALAATRVTFGKYVSDKVYLQYTQSLGSIYGDAGKLTQRGLSFPERQFSVEYRLSDRFSIEGETGTVGGLGYFDVDLKFRFGY